MPANWDLDPLAPPASAAGAPIVPLPLPAPGQVLAATVFLVTVRDSGDFGGFAAPSSGGRVALEWWDSARALLDVGVSVLPAKAAGALPEKKGVRIWAHTGHILNVTLPNQSITSIDLRGVPQLTELNLSGSAGLTSLDASPLAAAVTLAVNDCGLTSFIPPGGAALNIVNISNNDLSAAALDAIYTALPPPDPAGEQKSLQVSGNPGTAAADHTIAETKGWTVITGL